MTRMAEAAIDRVAITLRLNREVELKCYPPIADFVKFLMETVSGEAQGNFGNLLISNLTPGPDDANKIWVEVNGQRTSFVEKVLVNGKWQPWYFLAPNSYQWFDGRSPVPTGFKEIARTKTTDLKLTGAATAGELPEELILAQFVGY